MDKAIIDRVRAIDFSKEFIIDDVYGVSYTYNDFLERCNRIACSIREVTDKDMFIVIMENSVNLAMMYFVSLISGKRIAVIDPQKGKDEIEIILSSMPGYIIVCDDKKCEYEGYVVFGFSDLEKNDVHKSKFELCGDIKNLFIGILETRKDNEPYLITFTSGTSGIAKGVEHSFDNLCLTALALHKKVCSKENGTFLHVMPMTYMAGILNSIIYPFLIGDRIVIGKRFSIVTANSFWKTVIKYGCDLFWLSPVMLMMINKLDRGVEGELYCKEAQPIFLVGTAPLASDTRKMFNSRYGVEVYASYGLSETLFISIETSDSINKSEKNCVGEILEGVDYQIGLDGEYLISVPWMFLRYTNTNTAEYFKDKYYKTGDLVKINDNYLYVIGRSKDLIIKGGMNISPLMIENVVCDISNIDEVVVVAVRDKKDEERILCVYTTFVKDGCEELEKVIKRKVIDKLGKNYTIDYTWNVASIPRNINGKIDKKIIRQKWSQKNNLLLPETEMM